MALFVAPLVPLPTRRSISHSARVAVRPMRSRRNPTMVMPPLSVASAPAAFELISNDPWLAAWGGLLALFVVTLHVLGVRSPRLSEEECAPEPDGALHVLRVHTERPLCVALADGARAVRAGENLLSFSDAPAAHAAASELEAAAHAAGCVKGLRVSLARADPLGVSAELPLVPRSQAKWREVTEADEVDWMSDVHWEDTERTRWECDRMPGPGEDDAIEREWAQVLKSLTPFVARREEDLCKLCSGSGTRRCPRCGGASASAHAGSTFSCKCNAGTVPCDWCDGEGYAQ